MHQKRVRLPGYRRLYCCLRGGNGSKNAADFRPALYLQAVGRVVAEAGDLQEIVQMGFAVSSRVIMESS